MVLWRQSCQSVESWDEKSRSVRKNGGTDRTRYDGPMALITRFFSPFLDYKMLGRNCKFQSTIVLLTLKIKKRTKNGTHSRGMTEIWKPQSLLIHLSIFPLYDQWRVDDIHQETCTLKITNELFFLTWLPRPQITWKMMVDNKDKSRS